MRGALSHGSAVGSFPAMLLWRIRPQSTTASRGSNRETGGRPADSPPEGLLILNSMSTQPKQQEGEGCKPRTPHTTPPQPRAPETPRPPTHPKRQPTPHHASPRDRPTQEKAKAAKEEGRPRRRDTGQARGGRSEAAGEAGKFRAKSVNCLRAGTPRTPLVRSSDGGGYTGVRVGTAARD